MAYGKSGKSKLMGTKIGNHGKGGGFRLHSDVKDSNSRLAKHSKAVKMARKAV